jgi:ApaG protein
MLIGNHCEEPRTYSSITNGIRISVVPIFVDDSSDPLRSVFAFSYTVTIENLSDGIVQLLERHWIINSAGVQTAEVVGPGVVGVQPVLEAGQTFTYTSGAVIQEPIGSMHGSYTFCCEDGRYIEVEIPKFELQHQLVIH